MNWGPFNHKKSNLTDIFLPRLQTTFHAAQVPMCVPTGTPTRSLSSHPRKRLVTGHTGREMPDLEGESHLHPSVLHPLTLLCFSSSPHHCSMEWLCGDMCFLWVNCGIGIKSARIKFAFFKKHNSKLLLSFLLDLIYLEGAGRVQGFLDDLAWLSLLENPAKSIVSSSAG